MKQKEILEWFASRINFINEIPEKIVQVKLHNEIVRHFGKEYNRIYFTIELNINTIYTLPKTVEEKEANRIIYFISFGSKDFVSFYGYNDKEVQVHYYWGTELFKMLINKEIKYSIASYSIER